MTTSTREHLLGYLLGALEADEQAQIEQDLDRDPELRRELEILRTRVEPLSWLEDESEPPRGLASKTCDQIFAPATRDRVSFPLPDRHEPLRSQDDSAAAAPKVQFASRSESSTSTAGWSSADLVVMGGLCLALLVMLAPALHSNVEMARRGLCQNNLRTIGASLSDFAGLNPEGRFPSIEPTGRLAFAGMVAPILREHELLPRAEVFICPSDNVEIQVYSLDELNEANDVRLAEARRKSLGSMGYNLGVVIDGEYQAPRNSGRRHYALMAEMPSPDRPGNHGHGRNVLFEDEHVEYVLASHPTGGDDPFHNRRGLIKAGIGVNDAVVGASFVSPLGDDIQTVGFSD